MNWFFILCVSIKNALREKYESAFLLSNLFSPPRETLEDASIPRLSGVLVERLIQLLIGELKKYPVVWIILIIVLITQILRFFITKRYRTQVKDSQKILNKVIPQTTHNQQKLIFARTHDFEKKNHRKI